MNLKKYIWLAALPMIFTACQEDMLVKDSTKQGITMLTATMGEETPDGRAQIELGGTHAGKFMWNEGDAFTLFEFFNDGRPDPENREFSINDDYEDTNPSASADFSLCEESQALTPDNYFAAIYPSVDNSDAKIQLLNAEIGTNTVPCVSMSIQKPPYAMNQLEGDDVKEKDANYWKAYFKNNMFMKTSKIEKIQSSNTKVNFEHLCGLVRISYTNAHSTNVVIKEIRLNGNWQTKIYLDKGTFNIIEEYPQTVEGLSFNSDGFNCSIAPGETRDFYLLFFPNATTNVTNISITYVPDSDGTETETVGLSVYKGQMLNISGFEAGKTYWFRITETGEGENGYGLAWTAELKGGNEEGNQPGQGVLKDVTNCGDLIKALQSSEELIRIGADFDITLELDFDFEGHKEIKMQGHTLRAGFTGFKNLITNRGNLSISGGTIEGEAGGNLFYNAPSSQLELRGVSIVGRGAEQAIHLHRSSCTITDLNGEISSINMDGKTAIMNSESTLTIESGNITGMVRNYQNGKITIKAGTINGNLDFPETDSANQSASITIAKDGVTLIGTGWDDERINRN